MGWHYGHDGKRACSGGEVGQLYHRLFSLRQTGDNDDTYEVSEEDVLPNVEATGELIDTVAALARQMTAE